MLVVLLSVVVVSESEDGHVQTFWRLTTATPGTGRKPQPSRRGDALLG